MLGLPPGSSGKQRRGGPSTSSSTTALWECSSSSGERGSGCPGTTSAGRTRTPSTTRGDVGRALRVTERANTRRKDLPEYPVPGPHKTVDEMDTGHPESLERVGKDRGSSDFQVQGSLDVFRPFVSSSRVRNPRSSGVDVSGD